MWPSRIQLFEKDDSKNRIFFSRYASKHWAFEKYDWLKEWNLFFFFRKNDSKNWIFSNMTQRIEHFLQEFDKQSKNCFLFKNDSKNWTFFEKYVSKNSTFLKKKRCLEDFSEKFHSNFKTFFWMTQRIEFLFNMTHRNWTLLLNMSQSINLSFLEKMTQRIEPLCPIWLKELNLFFQFDSKNWTSFSNLTHRIEPQRKNDTKNWSSWTN